VKNVEGKVKQMKQANKTLTRVTVKLPEPPTLLDMYYTKIYEIYREVTGELSFLDHVQLYVKGEALEQVNARRTALTGLRSKLRDALHSEG